MTNINRSILFTISLVLILGAVFYVSVVSAAPVVTWTPNSEEESLIRGETKIHTVSFTSGKDLADVSLWVVHELAPYVTVSPSQLPLVHKGETVELNITFAASMDAPFAIHDGTLHLRATKGNKTYSKPLPITLAITVEPIPPDPGQAGMATMAGIDSDGDGVRDDVQRYIVINVPDSARHREALKDVARKSQSQILAQTKQEAIEVAHAGGRVFDCLEYLGVRKQGVWKEVKALVFNTEERLQALDVYNDRINGQVFSTTPDVLLSRTCSFDPASLPN